MELEGDFEERVRELEAHVTIQERILVNLQAELIEANRLNESVERLGEGATSLGEALLAVDKQQQTLTRLGRQLNDVEQQAATKQDLHMTREDVAAETAQLRRKALFRLGMALAVVAAVLGYEAITTHRYRMANYESCQARASQNRYFGDYLIDAAEKSLTQPGITPEQKKIGQGQIEILKKAFPPVNCKELKP